MSDWIGRTLSKVEIEKLLGKGGMAEVYLGQHTTLKRPVAVKVIHSHLAEDEELLTRFSDEAQQVATLRHPNIVQVMDYDVAEDNSPYMVMEYLEGIALSDYLKTQHKAGKTLPTEVVAGLIQDLADALDYAHQRGIIHRDIKPANVMLRAESSAIEEDEPLPDDVQSVLTDFGVARMQNVTAARTATGALIGTPTYMSPEQVQGTTVDARSDVYALGVMLYEMLAGKTPFDPGTDTPATILFKQVLEEPPPLENVDSEVQDVIDKALAKDPDERFQQAGELAAAFKEALGMEVAEGARIQSRDALSEMPTHFSITTQPMKIPHFQTSVCVNTGQACRYQRGSRSVGPDSRAGSAGCLRWQTGGGRGGAGGGRVGSGIRRADCRTHPHRGT
jgi:serine/threonine-protein kinase